MTSTIHLAQIDPTLGNLDANLALHHAAIEEASTGDTCAIFFPELSLTGYFLKDQTSEVAITLDAPPLQALRERSTSLTIGAGFVERARDGRLYNAYAIFENGELLHVHRKVHLATYGMFEESRDLAAGEHFLVAESRLGRIGVMTCEDLWHASSAWLYFLAGVELFLVPSAGPAHGVSANGEEGLGSVRTWQTLLSSAAILSQSWALYINRVGCEDGVTFGGGTRLIDPTGRERAALEGLDPGSLVCEFDLAATERARLQTPLRRDEKPWLVQRELRRFVDPES
jgi:NAD+ synthase (glutamine-hydrolysing)